MPRSTSTLCFLLLTPQCRKQKADERELQNIDLCHDKSSHCVRKELFLLIYWNLKIWTLSSDTVLLNGKHPPCWSYSVWCLACVFALSSLFLLQTHTHNNSTYTGLLSSLFQSDGLPVPQETLWRRTLRRREARVFMPPLRKVLPLQSRPRLPRAYRTFSNHHHQHHHHHHDIVHQQQGRHR